MAYQAFISYSSKDKTAADAVCTTLEASGVGCWIAPRDIVPGRDWSESIIDGINECQVMVLIFSANADASPQVKREVERAVNKGVAVLPFRIEAIMPSKSMEYFISSQHWLDAFTPPLEKHLEVLAERVAQLLAHAAKPSSVAGGAPGQTVAGPARNIPWNVPLKNPFFTGRETVLDELHGELTNNARLAVSGLPGIGKSQIAIEYAHRYRDQYRAVLWVNADTPDAIVSHCVEIAGLLDLPEKDEPDQNVIVTAVKRWLESRPDWLLLLDSANDLAVLRPYLPSAKHGSILMATRASATGTLARRIEIPKMTVEEGAFFLLRRAGVLGDNDSLDDADPDVREAALTIVNRVDGLPLALDQAGAFVEATFSSPAEYLELYETEGATLRAEYGDGGASDHESVSTTFLLAFSKVTDANPAAADLLRLCAFLAPDNIPEELLTEGAPQLGEALGAAAKNPLARTKMIGEACRYSLLSRDAETRTLTIHRMVQAVLRDGMDASEEQVWIDRAIRAVDSCFPKPEYAKWPLCERLLPHALACAALIQSKEAESAEAGRLLSNAGTYLAQRARYGEVEPLYRLSLAIRERALGLEHPDVSRSLNNLAILLSSQGKYTEAEPLYRQALSIREKTLGPEDPDVARAQYNLARLYFTQCKYSEAEPLLRQALAIWEKALGPEHPDLASSLNFLAGLYLAQGKSEEAEPLYRRALAIREKVLGPQHPAVAEILDNLATLFNEQGKAAEAEPLLRRSVAIQESALGPEHPDVAESLNSMAHLYYSQGNYAEAEPLFLRALAIREQAFGPEHPAVADSLEGLAKLYSSQGRTADAEQFCGRSLAIREAVLGPQHPATCDARALQESLQGPGISMIYTPPTEEKFAV